MGGDRFKEEDARPRQFHRLGVHVISSRQAAPYFAEGFTLDTWLFLFFLCFISYSFSHLYDYILYGLSLLFLDRFIGVIIICFLFSDPIEEWVHSLSTTLLIKSTP